MGEKSHKRASISYCLASRAAIKKEKHWPLANSFSPLAEDGFFAKGGRDEQLKLFPPSLYPACIHTAWEGLING